MVAHNPDATSGRAPEVPSPTPEVPSPAPEVSHAPRILVVDDAYFKALGVTSQLRDAGYIVEMARDPKDALAKIAAAKYDLVVVDGDLGDSCWDKDGISAQFIIEHLGGIPYGRYSSAHHLIPEGLRGSFCFEHAHEVTAWIKQNLPLDSAETKAMGNLPDAPSSMDLMIDEQPQTPPVNRSFPDIGELNPSAPGSPSHAD